MAKALDAEEEALAALLARAGLAPACARVFVALARGAGQGALELAGATGLARQEAGDAARDLELRGLVRIDRVPTGGRPAHRYHLAREVGDAVRALVAQRRKTLDDELAGLDALERRFG